MFTLGIKNNLSHIYSNETELYYAYIAKKKTQKTLYLEPKENTFTFLLLKHLHSIPE